MSSDARGQNLLLQFVMLTSMTWGLTWVYHHLLFLIPSFLRVFKKTYLKTLKLTPQRLNFLNLLSQVGTSGFTLDLSSSPFANWTLRTFGDSVLAPAASRLASQSPQRVP